MLGECFVNRARYEKERREGVVVQQESKEMGQSRSATYSEDGTHGGH